MMLRATFLALLDQGILSALSLVLAALLVRVAGREAFGLYSQLLSLQSLFSAVHAGMFVSAYLSIGARMGPGERAAYRAHMTRLELLLSPAMALASMALLAAGFRLAGVPSSPGLVIAFGFALLGLWWREFLRQAQFAQMRHDRALLVDGGYVLLLCALLAAVTFAGRLDNTTVFGAMAVAAIAATLPAMLATLRTAATRTGPGSGWLRQSWGVGRWDAVGSLATWAYSQSYVYIAALHGGLAEAGEVSAARLLAAPLPLFWASYSNVLRPRASQLLAEGSTHGLARLARRSLLLVLAVSLAWGLLLVALDPWTNRLAFGGQMQDLLPLSLWWVAYSGACGITTIASGMLRSGLAFRQVLLLQLASSVVALALLAASLRFSSSVALVVAMLVSECLSALVFWVRMDRRMLARVPASEVG